jgi:hypothetical protein
VAFDLTPLIPLSWKERGKKLKEGLMPLLDLFSVRFLGFAPLECPA